MNIDILTQAGLTATQAKIYLHLIQHGQSTPTEIAKAINEKRTTIYSAIEKLEALEVIKRQDCGKISAYIPCHPSVIENIAEKRLRLAARNVKNLEANLPSLINFYNKFQNEPGATTVYGEQGIRYIWDKVLSTGETYYFVRSRHDKISSREHLDEFKRRRAERGIKSENITSSDFINDTNKTMQDEFLLTRTLLPASEYDSPVEIDIFGNNVAFINYAKDGMSTIIESPEIADAMRQFFLIAKKYIRKSTDQTEMDSQI